MKKVISLFLCFVLLSCALVLPSAAAENISDLTFDQLIELRRKIEKEIVSRPEWKEVTVPAGIYKVGEDIPAGVYSIRLPNADGCENFSIWGVEYENYRDGGGCIMSELLDDENPTFGKLELKAGNVVYISGPLVFAPSVSPFQF